MGEDAGLDFASDKNPHKNIARKMMKMTEAINKKYLDKVGEGHKMEHITCVTCHMGKVHPVVSVDSLWVK